MTCETYETLEAVDKACRQIDMSRPRYVLTCGLCWYAEMIKSVLTSQRYPDAQTNLAVSNNYRLLFDAGWATFEIGPSQHLPPGQIYIGTEEEYLHALADREARRILLEDPQP